jgi:hypothetical protein
MKHPLHFSDDELSLYADRHIAYEVDMLRWAASILHPLTAYPFVAEEPRGAVAEALGNVALESFAMHTRNLIDFLYLRSHYRNDRPSDVILEDYLAPDALSDALPAITPLLADAKTKADKQIAHLASDRLHYGPFDRSWMYTLIFADLIAGSRRRASMPPSKEEPD